MPELLDTLASYIPALITRRLAEDPALPTAPVGNRFSAATLFADITGLPNDSPSAPPPARQRKKYKDCHMAADGKK